MTTVQDINKQLRERYPIGCRVQFYRMGDGWDRLTAIVVGYRHYAYGAETLIVEMETDQPYEIRGEAGYWWRAGDRYHLTGGDQAYLSRLPDRQREIPI